MQKLEGIQRYYHRLRQSESGSDYYIEPRTSCPIDVLNQQDKFVILTFDKDDDYIVVNDHRYYLTKRVAIKATDKLHAGLPWLISTSWNNQSLTLLKKSLPVKTL